MGSSLDQYPLDWHALCFKLLHATSSGTHESQCRSSSREQRVDGYRRIQLPKLEVHQQVEEACVGFVGGELHTYPFSVSVSHAVSPSSIWLSQPAVQRPTSQLLMLITAVTRYNSAVFQSLTSFNYTVAVVKDSFINGTSWSLATAEDNRRDDPGWTEQSAVNPTDWDYTTIITEMQKAAAAGEYLHKNVTECFDFYNDYFAPQGNVLVFVKNESIQTPSTDSLLLYVGIVPRSDNWAKNMWAVANGTARFVLRAPSHPVTVWYIGKPHYEVDHCLVQQPALTSGQCRFQYSPWIMWIVCGFNLMKVSVMLWVWIIRRWQDRAKNDHQKQILYTLGDAIASFMRHPSSQTRDMCLATRYDFLSRRPWKNRLVKQWPVPSREPRAWVSRPRRWREAASLRRWIILLTM